jgi:translation initiation factor IF-2
MTTHKTKTESAEMKKPPVVVIVGHIDHGKSTLLDYIRKTNIVAGEAGGITQHISAYEVEHETEGKKELITFLDTPGHESFSSMRNRGAQIADLAILIVSAEEGVKAQTKEALKSIRDAGLPFLVAINKIDKPNANPEKIKQELAENEVFVESYGGTIPSVNISAKTGIGIDELLDMIILVSDLDPKTGNPKNAGKGIILETNRDPKIGITATVIIKDGTFTTGDFVGAGAVVAKVKKMEDFAGRQIKEAHFSSPVLLYGFSEVPTVGEPIITFKDKKEADTYLKNISTNTKSQTNNTNANTNDNGELVEIPVVIKADTVGTLEAVEKEIGQIADDRVRLKIVSSGIGAITDTDIKIVAGSTNPLVVGFQVKVDKSARDIAERFEVAIHTFDIIYKLTEWLAEEVVARRPKVLAEEILGKAKVLKVFSQTKDKQVIGGQVTEGVFSKNKEVKIIRREVEIGRGKVVQLEQNKTKADKVESGSQFGTLIESKISIAQGDILEVFQMTAK